MRYQGAPRMRVVAVLLALAVASAAAHADDSVGLVVTGGGDLHGKVTAHLRGWLERHGYTPVDAPLSDDAITTITNCLVIDDPKCASAVVDARAKARSVLFARLDVARPGNTVTFTTYWFVKGGEATGQRRACEACQGEAWRATSEDMLGELNGELARKTGDTSHLAEREVPVHPGDGRRERELRPGEPGSHVLPAVVLGAGIVGIGASAGFFYYGAKGGPTEKYNYPDATAWGIGLAVVGAGATLGGVMLWRQADTTSAPVAAISPHGGYFGWITRF
jgi:hypothetical protein